MVVCPYDITYCANEACPFKDCERQLRRAKGFPPGTQISVSDFSGMCRRYISWLVDRERKKPC